MGEEIRRPSFEPSDFERFRERLRHETALLGSLLADGSFAEDGPVGGFELEAWLVDRNQFPLPDNERFLAHLADPLVVPELSRFNVELNGAPQPLRADALRRIEHELDATWRRAVCAAHVFGGTLAAIGILPTLREDDLCVANMSTSNRYRALNEQVLAARRGRPIRIDIRGRERLALAHPDMMLEAAATSFQVHLQVPAARAVRYFNASQLLSAPLVAIAANSPFLFQASLWDETRIPLFEQAVDTSAPAGDDGSRVTFGERWLQDSIVECFEDNLARFAPLLPIVDDVPARTLRHLRLHNGTIWRWNRPLVGFDAAGRPHLRVEHRPLPAGPSVPDMLANAALYWGAVHELALAPVAPETRLDFEQARGNFYRAARDGLDAELVWLDGKRTTAARLLRDTLLPIARDGLARMALHADDVDRSLDVIAARLRTGQTGAAWQRAYIAEHGRDFFALVADYVEHQRSGMPVHEWSV